MVFWQIVQIMFIIMAHLCNISAFNSGNGSVGDNFSKKKTTQTCGTTNTLTLFMSCFKIPVLPEFC